MQALGRAVTPVPHPRRTQGMGASQPKGLRDAHGTRGQGQSPLKPPPERESGSRWHREPTRAVQGPQVGGCEPAPSPGLAPTGKYPAPLFAGMRHVRALFPPAPTHSSISTQIFVPAEPTHGAAGPHLAEKPSSSSTPRAFRPNAAFFFIYFYYFFLTSPCVWREISSWKPSPPYVWRLNGHPAGWKQ